MYEGNRRFLEEKSFSVHPPFKQWILGIHTVRCKAIIELILGHLEIKFITHHELIIFLQIYTIYAKLLWG